ncbi:hypothetical protein FGF04_20455 [Streptomyces apricus]|uniref:Uncharacterized protein n=1 Tax=Streptomyces apricus TaxID=1828112 RepID=A0A5B0AQN5_9ACTN|nr:hypothetical protein FGF04_20455 [Streptomyces apricus]
MPAGRGVAYGKRGSRRCSRDEISPRRRGVRQVPDLSVHHAAKPGVDAPKNRQRKDSYSVLRIGTQGNG